MKHAPSLMLGLIASATFTLDAGPAYADAVGPYYATPSWDQTLPASTRFIVLSNMNGEAILDRETGLVWEKAPDTTYRTWEAARRYCVNKTVGNRKGWRLPTVDELATLYNTAGTGSVGGEPGNPFISVSNSWTSTIYVDNLGSADLGGFAVAYIVSFTIGGNDGAFPQNTAGTFQAWCVRGASAGNTQ